MFGPDDAAAVFERVALGIPVPAHVGETVFGQRDVAHAVELYHVTVERQDGDAGFRIRGVLDWLMGRAGPNCEFFILDALIHP